MKQHKTNSLRIFLALCMMVQFVLPSMVYSVKATGTNPSITINFKNNVDVTAKSFVAIKVLGWNETDDVYSSFNANNYFKDYLVTLDPNASSFSYAPSVQVLLITKAIEDNSDGDSTYARTLATALEDLARDDDNLVTYTGTTLNDVSGQSITGEVTEYGYYLILDTSTDGPFYPSMLLEVLPDFPNPEITLKASVPTITKEIYHNEEDKWGPVGDNQIGDEVEFLVTVTLPQDVTGFDDYYYVVHDDMDEDQFEFTASSLEVYDDYDSSSRLNGKYYVDITSAGGVANGFAIRVEILDLWETNDYPEELQLYFTATLLEAAEIASDFNENTATLTYSDSVHAQWDGSTIPSDVDDPDDIDIGSFDKDEDTVYDYTFSVKIIKQDLAGTGLPNAEFNLFNLDDDSSMVDPLTFVFDGTATYTLLTDSDSSGTTTITSPSDGTFYLNGLDDSVEYCLEETNPPSGYSLVNKTFTFTIASTYKSDYVLDTLEIEVYADDDTDEYEKTFDTDNVIGFEIINTSGGTLPETGGVGTVMFYVVGVGMMVAAGALIYIKRKN